MRQRDFQSLVTLCAKRTADDNAGPDDVRHGEAFSRSGCANGDETGVNERGRIFFLAAAANFQMPTTSLTKPPLPSSERGPRDRSVICTTLNRIYLRVLSVVKPKSPLICVKVVLDSYERAGEKEVARNAIPYWRFRYDIFRRYFSRPVNRKAPIGRMIYPRDDAINLLPRVKNYYRNGEETRRKVAQLRPRIII